MIFFVLSKWSTEIEGLVQRLSQNNLYITVYLIQNDREVLYLSDASLYMKNTHLVGSMSSEFAGDRWVAETDGNETRERDIDTIETLCAIRKYDEEHCPDYYKRVTVKFENQYYNTRYLFLPSKTGQSWRERNYCETK